MNKSCLNEAANNNLKGKKLSAPVECHRVAPSGPDSTRAGRVSFSFADPDSNRGFYSWVLHPPERFRDQKG